MLHPPRHCTPQRASARVGSAGSTEPGAPLAARRRTAASPLRPGAGAARGSSPDPRKKVFPIVWSFSQCSRAARLPLQWLQRRRQETAGQIAGGHGAAAAAAVGASAAGAATRGAQRRGAAALLMTRQGGEIICAQVSTCHPRRRRCPRVAAPPRFIPRCLARAAPPTLRLPPGTPPLRFTDGGEACRPPSIGAPRASAAAAAGLRMQNTTGCTAGSQTGCAIG